MDRTAAFYASPSYAQRGGIPIFSGSRRQRGGSILGAIKNFFMPLLPGIRNYAVNKAKSTALGLTKGIMSDVVQGKNIGQSIRRHGIAAAKSLGKNALNDTLGIISGSRTQANRVGKRKRKPLKRPAKRPRTATTAPF